MARRQGTGKGGKGSHGSGHSENQGGSRPKHKERGKGGPQRKPKPRPGPQQQRTDGPRSRTAVSRRHGLLQPPSGQAAALLDSYGKILDKAVPLPAKHRRDTPLAVRELSRLLTRDRAELSSDYMRSPRMISAYLRYFLPWNLYRLSLLLPGLAPLLTLDTGGTVADLGSGPLTSAQALWLAMDQWRGFGLDIHCMDRSQRIMTQGRAVLNELMRAAPGPLPPAGAIDRDGEKRSSPWRVFLDHGPLHKGLAGVGKPLDLVLAVNVLNEALRMETGRRGAGEAVSGFAAKLLARIKLPGEQRPGEQGLGGQLLLVEPGTRSGGEMVVRMREAALEQGFSPLSPCTHAEPCPLAGRDMWCHFRTGTEHAPVWLRSLSKAAGLGKESASLSFVLLGRSAAPRESGRARVLSNAIRVGGARAWYGCSRHGLLLVSAHKGGELRQGEQVDYELDPAGARDEKSGALIALAGGEAGKNA
ncbi:MAG: ribosomal methyltransferase [Desulfovibrio sp.]|nr:MAG: ribosomal methyltransferase [Desulfovibrio sp.]